MAEPLAIPRPFLPQTLLAQWLSRAVLGMALAAFLGYFLVYAYYAVALFRFPFDYDQGEGFELQDTILLSQGHWPYRDNSLYPFYASNYPPLFHLLAVPLLPLGTLSGNPYLPGRLLSFSATLVTAGAIAWAVQHRVRRPGVAALAGLAFLASNYVYHIGPLFRLHMTMVMFETLGVVALAAWAEDGGPGDEGTRGRAGLLALALALLLAAGYTKQMALATVVAAFVFLFLRRPRLAVVAAVPFALVAAGLFWGLNQVTGGQWYVNIIAANINAYDFGQAIGLYQQWFRLHTVLILLAAGSAICELYFDRLSIYAIWFAFAVANSGLAGKWGAGESYFTTAVAAACMLGGIAAGRLWTTAERRGPRLAWITSLAISGLFLVQAGLVAHLPTGSPRWAAVAQVLGWPAGTPVGPQPTCAGERPAHLLPYYDAGGYTQVGRPPTPADTAAGWQITQLVASAPGPSLSEDAGFALQAGKDLTANPTQLLNLVQNGLLDSRRMVQWIRERRYGTIVLRAQFYPPAVLQAIGQAYAPVAQVEMNGFVYCVLKPGQ